MFLRNIIIWLALIFFSVGGSVYAANYGSWGISTGNPGEFFATYGTKNLESGQIESSFKGIIITDENTAIANCQDEIDTKHDEYIPCSAQNDISSIHQFYTLLQSSRNQSKAFMRLFNLFSAGLFHVGSFGDLKLLAIKKIDNGYINLEQSEQYNGIDNIVFIYYGIQNGKSVVFYYSLDDDPQAKDIITANAKKYCHDKEMSCVVGETRNATPGLYRFYQDMTKEFLAGKFQNPLMQERFDAFLEETKTVKATVESLSQNQSQK